MARANEVSGVEGRGSSEIHGCPQAAKITTCRVARGELRGHVVPLLAAWLMQPMPAAKLLLSGGWKARKSYEEGVGTFGEAAGPGRPTDSCNFKERD